MRKAIHEFGTSAVFLVRIVDGLHRDPENERTTCYQNYSS